MIVNSVFINLICENVSTIPFKIILKKASNFSGSDNLKCSSLLNKTEHSVVKSSNLTVGSIPLVDKTSFKSGDIKCKCNPIAGPINFHFLNNALFEM